jgi:photosystem II stability/assembly factor-like uncharacterized protein
MPVTHAILESRRHDATSARSLARNAHAAKARRLGFGAAIVLLAWHASLALAGANQWTPIGPQGAEIVALTVDPGTPTIAYAGTRGSGILKSVDGGAHWNVAGKGLPGVPVRAIAIDPRAPSTLYAGTAGAGLYKSVDAGTRWVPINGDLGDATQADVNAIAVDPATPTTLYAATSSGLLKSRNAGTSWTPIGTGAIFPDVTVVAVDPSRPSTIYAGSFDVPSLARSEDAGATWSPNLLGRGYGTAKWSRHSPSALLIDPRAPSRLYVALGSEVLLKSVDHGATWARMAVPGEGSVTLAADPASFDTLYAGAYTGRVYRSTDAGMNWVTAAMPPANAPITAVAVGASGASLHVGTRHGLLHSVDDGASWAQAAVSTRAANVANFIVDPNAPSTIYSTSDWPLENVLMKTTDSGANWTGLPLPGSFRAYSIDPVATSTLYAAGYDDATAADAVYKSVDAGKSWTTIYASKRVDTLAMASSHSATLYVSAAEGLQRSSDGGSTWSRMTNPGVVSALAVHPSRPEMIYAGTYGAPAGSIAMSTDGGGHWRKLAAPIPDATAVYQLAMDPAEPSTVYAVFGPFWDPVPGGLLKSIDGGETWVELVAFDPAYFASSVVAIDASDARRLYLAIGHRGVYRSTDGGANWTTINSGLPSLDITGITVDRTGKLLRAATPFGMFEYDLAPAPVPQVTPVIEYYHASADHYFITASSEEIEALDSRRFAGWMRTGFEFGAYAMPVADTQPVCRYFSAAFGAKGAHFYSPFASECAALRADRHWTLETPAAFYVAPATASGGCVNDWVPVYRLYNDGRGGAPNHRFTGDLALRAQMIAQGWIAEGLGATAVTLCAPR